MTSSSTSHPVARRYAQALVAQAQKQGQLAQVIQQTQAILETLTADDYATLALPTFRPAQRLTLAQEVAKALKLDTLLTNTLLLLAQARRLALLEATLQATLATAAQAQGQLLAHVESAQALTAPQVQQVRAQLKKLFPKVTGIHLTQQVTPGLKAGHRLFAEGKVWDLTLTGRLQQLFNLLSQTQAKHL